MTDILVNQFTNTCANDTADVDEQQDDTPDMSAQLKGQEAEAVKTLVEQYLSQHPRVVIAQDYDDACVLRKLLGDEQYCYPCDNDECGPIYCISHRLPDTAPTDPWFQHEITGRLLSASTPEDKKAAILAIPNNATLVSVHSDENYDWSLHDMCALPKSVIELYLGHDCTIKVGGKGTTETITELLTSLPNLQSIDYCGYYADYDGEDIKAVAQTLGRTVYCHEIL